MSEWLSIDKKPFRFFCLFLVAQVVAGAIGACLPPPTQRYELACPLGLNCALKDPVGDRLRL
jgi:hypothetical protein